MSTLQDFVPTMSFPLPEGSMFRRTTTSTSTAPYHLSVPLPGQDQRPVFLVNDPLLPTRMLESLATYLTTAPGRDKAPSNALTSALSVLSLTANNFAFGHENTSASFFERVFTPISLAVMEVDQNVGLPEPVTQRILHNHLPDGIYAPYPEAVPQLHLELKSWTVFSHYAPHIEQLSQRGEELHVTESATGHLAIIFKIGISMLARQTKIPYAILFGGDRYMIFAASPVADNPLLHGLVCSNVLNTIDPRFPFMSLVVFCLLNGNSENGGGIKLKGLRDIAVPTVTVVSTLGRTRSSTTAEKKTTKYETLTSSMGALTLSLQRCISQAKCLQLTFDVPTCEYVTYDLDLIVSSARRDEPSPLDFLLSLPFSFIAHGISRLLLLHPRPLFPLRHQVKIEATRFLGSGSVGNVFCGRLVGTDVDDIALKVATDPQSKVLLAREARVYLALSKLQGDLVPKFYGLFVGQNFHVLAMQYAGKAPESFENLTKSQRLSVWTSLRAIHAASVHHGDCQPSNVALSATGAVQVIDFSHAVFLDCGNENTCAELRAYREILQI